MRPPYEPRRHEAALGMSRCVRSLTTAIALGACGGACAAADEVDPFALSPEQLFDATVISVSKTPEKLSDAPAAVFVLTAEDIARSGATSIPEALRMVPGVQVARINSAGWAVSIRGFNGALTNKLLVLIDGRTVYDPLFSGVYWDVQDTALEDIERIEVIRGPGASLWGANAVNGVINIITKSASQTHGLLASLVMGDDDRALVTLRYGGQSGERLNWRVYGKYVQRADHRTPFGASANDDVTAWRGGFRLDWGDDGRDSFTLQGDAYDSDSAQDRSVPRLTAPFATVVTEDISTFGGNILGRWMRNFADGSRLTVQGYADLTARRQFTLGERRTTIDADIQYEFATSKHHRLIAGAGYRYSSDRLTLSPIISSTDDTLTQQVFSAFVQDTITLEPERLFLTIGSKFEYNDFTGFEFQPNIRLRWSDGDGQTVWAAVTRSLRTPSALEQDLGVLAGVIPPGAFPFPVSVELRPSPDFESEELIAYEAGYLRQWTPEIETNFSVFYNDYDKLATLTLLPPEIAPNPLHLVLPIATTNLTAARTCGFEAVLDWHASDSFTFMISYAYLYMNLEGPPASLAIASEAAEQRSPRHQFLLRSQWNVSDRVSLDSTLYYVDSLPAFDIDAYWRLDARLGWRLSDDLQFDLVGQNLLDSHREFGAISDANATTIGRSIHGKLTWRL